MRQLVEKVELHDKLNPKIWNEDGTLRKEVEEKLHEIIDQFILELDDSDIPIKVLDARIVGSNASFNYAENSDLDIHIIANFNEASCDTNVLSLLYNYFKKNFNNIYNISIHGVPIELYIEDVGSSAVSNGIFSLYKNEWIKFPEPIEIPDIDITQEYAKYESKYNNIINSGDAEEADKLIDELYLLRKDSLSTEGEYGVGNLIFKQFRNDGYLDNLKQLLVDNTAKELSLEALSESSNPEIFYRITVINPDGKEAGLFRGLNNLMDDLWDRSLEDDDAEEAWEEINEPLSILNEYTKNPDNFPQNTNAIFAYKENTFNKFEQQFEDLKYGLNLVGWNLKITKIYRPDKIIYEDDDQIAYDPKTTSVVEWLNEAKEDKQKLIDHVGKEDAEYFFKLKDSGRLKPPYNDLYYWLKRKPSELNNYINDVGLTITKSQQRKLDKQGADLLYDEDGWKVYKINTYDSAKYYGKGTKWCISGNYAGQEEQGQYYFNEYLSKGVNGYYFIINPFGEKWCWLDVDAEFKDAPLWDEEDNGVTNTRSVYMPNNFPEGVIGVLPNAEEFFTFPEDIIEEHIANDVLEVDDEVVNILNSYDIYLQDFRFRTLYWNTDAHVKYIIGYIPQMEKLIILNGNDSDIERGTFAGDTGLRVIYLPYTIGVIFKGAFDDATNLSDIYTDMDEDEFKRKYKGNIEEDLRDINIHYDTFQEDAVHKILYEKLNESAYFSSMEGMIEQAADRNPKPEDFFEQPWDALVDPNRFFKEITNNISKDATQKVDRRINLNDKNNKFYKVLLNFLDAYKIPAYKRDSYTYDKLEPATMVEYSNGVRVPVDGKHTAKLCSRLGIKLPVRIIMKESLHESVNTSKVMNIVDKIIENDLRLRISNNPPKFGKPFFILPDGTFLSGFYAHTNVEEILQDIGLSFYDDIDFQTPENYNYSTLLDLGCVRGRVDKVENYIQLPDDRPTSSQIDAIADAIFFAMTSGGSYIGKSGIFIEAPDTEQSRFYSFDDYEPEDIVAKIKRYYSSGILYETLEEEYLDDNEEFWDYRTKDISGKIAFDKTRSETPFGQRMIELANSGGTDSRDRKAFFYEMSPKEYFQACADGFGNSYQANINQVNDEIIPHLKEVLTKYKKMFPVGYLEYTNGNFGQEGRHRMFAAGEIFGWDTKQPVLIIYDGDRPTIPTHKKEYDPVKSEISDDELADELDFDDLELLEDLAILEEDIEAMKPHYPNIPENRFQSIIELDPTYKSGSANAGTYGKWLLSLANRNGGRVDDEEYITDVLTKFEDNKKFLKEKDTMKFKTIYDVDDYLNDEDSYKEESARQKLRRTQKDVRAYDLEKGADKVFDGDDWMVYKIGRAHV